MNNTKNKKGTSGPSSVKKGAPVSFDEALQLGRHENRNIAAEEAALHQANKKKYSIPQYKEIKAAKDEEEANAKKEGRDISPFNPIEEKEKHNRWVKYAREKAKTEDPLLHIESQGANAIRAAAGKNGFDYDEQLQSATKAALEYAKKKNKQQLTEKDIESSDLSNGAKKILRDVIEKQADTEGNIQETNLYSPLQTVNRRLAAEARLRELSNTKDFPTQGLRSAQPKDASAKDAKPNDPGDLERLRAALGAKFDTPAPNLLTEKLQEVNRKDATQGNKSVAGQGIVRRAVSGEEIARRQKAAMSNVGPAPLLADNPVIAVEHTLDGPRQPVLENDALPERFTPEMFRAVHHKEVIDQYKGMLGSIASSVVGSDPQTGEYVLGDIESAKRKLDDSFSAAFTAMVEMEGSLGERQNRGDITLKEAIYHLQTVAQDDPDDGVIDAILSTWTGDFLESITLGAFTGATTKAIGADYGKDEGLRALFNEYRTHRQNLEQLRRMKAWEGERIKPVPGNTVQNVVSQTMQSAASSSIGTLWSGFDRLAKGRDQYYQDSPKFGLWDLIVNPDAAPPTFRAEREAILAQYLSPEEASEFAKNPASGLDPETGRPKTEYFEQVFRGLGSFAGSISAGPLRAGSSGMKLVKGVGTSALSGSKSIVSKMLSGPRAESITKVLQSNPGFRALQKAVAKVEEIPVENALHTAGVFYLANMVEMAPHMTVEETEKAILSGALFGGIESVIGKAAGNMLMRANKVQRAAKDVDLSKLPSWVKKYVEVDAKQRKELGYMIGAMVANPIQTKVSGALMEGDWDNMLNVSDPQVLVDVISGLFLGRSLGTHYKNFKAFNSQGAPKLDVLASIGRLHKDIKREAEAAQVKSDQGPKKDPQEPVSEQPVSEAQTRFTKAREAEEAAQARANQRQPHQDVEATAKESVVDEEPLQANRHYRLSEIAKEIDTQEFSQFQQEMAGKVLELSKDAQVVFGDYETAYYDNATKTLHMPNESIGDKKALADALVHEGMHYLTVDAVNNNPEIGTELLNILNQLGRRKEWQDWVVENPEEFEYYTSNPAELLAAMVAGKGSFGHLLDVEGGIGSRLRDVVGKVFGKEAAPDQAKDMVREILSKTEKKITPDEVIQKLEADWIEATELGDYAAADAIQEQINATVEAARTPEIYEMYKDIYKWQKSDLKERLKTEVDPDGYMARHEAAASEFMRTITKYGDMKDETVFKSLDQNNRNQDPTWDQRDPVMKLKAMTQQVEMMGREMPELMEALRAEARVVEEADPSESIKFAADNKDSMTKAALEAQTRILGFDSPAQMDDWFSSMRNDPVRMVDAAKTRLEERVKDMPIERQTEARKHVTQFLKDYLRRSHNKEYIPTYAVRISEGNKVQVLDLPSTLNFNPITKKNISQESENLDVVRTRKNAMIGRYLLGETSKKPFMPPGAFEIMNRIQAAPIVKVDGIGSQDARFKLVNSSGKEADAPAYTNGLAEKLFNEGIFLIPKGDRGSLAVDFSGRFTDRTQKTGFNFSTPQAREAFAKAAYGIHQIDYLNRESLWGPGRKPDIRQLFSVFDIMKMRDLVFSEPKEEHMEEFLNPRIAEELRARQIEKAKELWPLLMDARKHLQPYWHDYRGRPKEMVVDPHKNMHMLWHSGYVDPNHVNTLEKDKGKKIPKYQNKYYGHTTQTNYFGIADNSYIEGIRAIDNMNGQSVIPRLDWDAMHPDEAAQAKEEWRSMGIGIREDGRPYLRHFVMTDQFLEANPDIHEAIFGANRFEVQLNEASGQYEPVLDADGRPIPKAYSKYHDGATTFTNSRVKDVLAALYGANPANVSGIKLAKGQDEIYKSMMHYMDFESNPETLHPGMKRLLSILRDQGFATFSAQNAIKGKARDYNRSYYEDDVKLVHDLDGTIVGIESGGEVEPIKPEESLSFYHGGEIPLSSVKEWDLVGPDALRYVNRAETRARPRGPALQIHEQLFTLPGRTYLDKEGVERQKQEIVGHAMTYIKNTLPAFKKVADGFEHFVLLSKNPDLGPGFYSSPELHSFVSDLHSSLLKRDLPQIDDMVPEQRASMATMLGRAIGPSGKVDTNVLHAVNSLYGEDLIKIARATMGKKFQDFEGVATVGASAKLKNVMNIPADIAYGQEHALRVLEQDLLERQERGEELDPMLEQQKLMEYIEAVQSASFDGITLLDESQGLIVSEDILNNLNDRIKRWRAQGHKIPYLTVGTKVLGRLVPSDGPESFVANVIIGVAREPNTIKNNSKSATEGQGRDYDGDDYLFTIESPEWFDETGGNALLGIWDALEAIGTHTTGGRSGDKEVMEHNYKPELDSYAVNGPNFANEAYAATDGNLVSRGAGIHKRPARLANAMGSSSVDAPALSNSFASLVRQSYVDSYNRGYTSMQEEYAKSLQNIQQAAGAQEAIHPEGLGPVSLFGPFTKDELQGRFKEATVQTSITEAIPAVVADLMPILESKVANSTFERLVSNRLEKWLKPVLHAFQTEGRYHSSPMRQWAASEADFNKMHRFDRAMWLSQASFMLRTGSYDKNSHVVKTDIGIIKPGMHGAVLEMDAHTSIPLSMIILADGTIDPLVSKALGDKGITIQKLLVQSGVLPSVRYDQIPYDYQGAKKYLDENPSHVLLKPIHLKEPKADAFAKLQREGYAAYGVHVGTDRNKYDVPPGDPYAVRDLIAKARTEGKIVVIAENFFPKEDIRKYKDYGIPDVSETSLLRSGGKVNDEWKAAFVGYMASAAGRVVSTSSSLTPQQAAAAALVSRVTPTQQMSGRHVLEYVDPRWISRMLGAMRNAGVEPLLPDGRTFDGALFDTIVHNQHEKTNPQDHGVYGEFSVDRYQAMQKSDAFRSKVKEYLGKSWLDITSEDLKDNEESWMKIVQESGLLTNPDTIDKVLEVFSPDLLRELESSQETDTARYMRASAEVKEQRNKAYLQKKAAILIDALAAAGQIQQGGKGPGIMATIKEALVGKQSTVSRIRKYAEDLIPVNSMTPLHPVVPVNTGAEPSYKTWGMLVDSDQLTTLNAGVESASYLRHGYMHEYLNGTKDLLKTTSKALGKHMADALGRVDSFAPFEKGEATQEAFRLADKYLRGMNVGLGTSTVKSSEYMSPKVVAEGRYDGTQGVAKVSLMVGDYPVELSTESPHTEYDGLVEMLVPSDLVRDKMSMETRLREGVVLSKDDFGDVYLDSEGNVVTDPFETVETRTTYADVDIKNLRKAVKAGLITMVHNHSQSAYYESMAKSLKMHIDNQVNELFPEGSEIDNYYRSEYAKLVDMGKQTVEEMLHYAENLRNPYIAEHLRSMIFVQHAPFMRSLKDALNISFEKEEGGPTISEQKQAYWDDISEKLAAAAAKLNYTDLDVSKPQQLFARRMNHWMREESIQLGATRDILRQEIEVVKDNNKEGLYNLDDMVIAMALGLNDDAQYNSNLVQQRSADMNEQFFMKVQGTMLEMFMQDQKIRKTLGLPTIGTDIAYKNMLSMFSTDQTVLEKNHLLHGKAGLMEKVREDRAAGAAYTLPNALGLDAGSPILVSYRGDDDNVQQVGGRILTIIHRENTTKAPPAPKLTATDELGKVSQAAAIERQNQIISEVEQGPISSLVLFNVNKGTVTMVDMEMITGLLSGHKPGKSSQWRDRSWKEKIAASAETLSRSLAENAKVFTKIQMSEADDKADVTRSSDTRRIDMSIFEVIGRKDPRNLYGHMANITDFFAQGHGQMTYGRGLEALGIISGMATAVAGVGVLPFSPQLGVSMLAGGVGFAGASAAKAGVKYGLDILGNRYFQAVRSYLVSSDIRNSYKLDAEVSSEKEAIVSPIEQARAALRFGENTDLPGSQEALGYAQTDNTVPYLNALKAMEMVAEKFPNVGRAMREEDLQKVQETISKYETADLQIRADIMDGRLMLEASTKDGVLGTLAELREMNLDALNTILTVAENTFLPGLAKVPLHTVRYINRRRGQANKLRGKSEGVGVASVTEKSALAFDKKAHFFENMNNTDLKLRRASYIHTFTDTIVGKFDQAALDRRSPLGRVMSMYSQFSRNVNRAMTVGKLQNQARLEGVSKIIAEDAGYTDYLRNEFGIIIGNEMLAEGFTGKTLLMEAGLGVAKGIGKPGARMLLKQAVGLGVYNVLEEGIGEIFDDTTERMFNLSSLVSSVIANAIEFFVGGALGTVEATNKKDKQTASKALVKPLIDIARESALGYGNTVPIENSLLLLHYLAYKADMIPAMKEEDYTRNMQSVVQKAASAPGFLPRVVGDQIKAVEEAGKTKKKKSSSTNKPKY